MYQAQKAQVKHLTPNVGRNQEPIETRDMTAKVYKKQVGYQVYFSREWITFNSLKEAQERANEINFEYFSKHKDKLPKGITVDESNQRFRFFIRLNHETVKHIISSKDLNKVIETRNHILKNLLDLF